MFAMMPEAYALTMPLRATRYLRRHAMPMLPRRVIRRYVYAAMSLIVD